MRKTLSKAARALRRRQVSLDKTIARSRRTIKSLAKKLRRETAVLSRRQKRRAKMK